MASSTSHPLEQRPVPAPSNPVLLSKQAQWLFTDEELTRSPSLLDGMKLEAEHMSRSKGVNFIMQVGIMLKLPQLTLATAAVYLHRFFMRFSMVDLPQRPGMHPYPIAATALFLATKVEENVRRMRELVMSCCRVAQKQPNLQVDEQSKEFWKWRDTILHHEDLLLEALCFDLQLEQPYRILYDLICFFNVSEHKPLRNASWAFVNDSMFTPLCLQFTARTIAAAALYAAARHCGLAFEDDALGRPWWEQVDVDLAQVRRACTRMAQLYESNASQRHSQYYPTTPIISDEGAEKTRIPHTGSPSASSSLGAPTTATADGAVNGRKRSRDPEDRSARDHPSEHAPGPLNGDRSPKRQRMGSSSEAPPHSSSSSFSHDRYPPINGHPPAPSSSSHRIPHSHPHHESDSHPSSTSQGARRPMDPIQRQIDEIVQRNLSHGETETEIEIETGTTTETPQDASQTDIAEAEAEAAQTGTTTTEAAADGPQLADEEGRLHSMTMSLLHPVDIIHHHHHHHLLLLPRPAHQRIRLLRRHHHHHHHSSHSHLQHHRREEQMQMKNFLVPLLCLTATSSALAVSPDNTAVEESGLQKRNPVAIVGMFIELLRGTQIIGRTKGRLNKVGGGPASPYEAESGNCLMYISTQGGGNCNVNTTPGKSTGLDADPTKHDGDWNVCWWDDKAKMSGRQFFTDPGIGKYSIVFTAKDQDIVNEEIEGTEACGGEGICNPQVTFYRDGYNIVLNTWQSDAGDVNMEYGQGLCSGGVTDAYKKGGMEFGYTCAVPCEGDEGLPDDSRF
ncbi:putative cyclin [Aspergillus candidus]|uniref:RNA polymerase II holoenzyme cyclin-like subunit n=1 Tax=Aspergillus candidus TaxID=41067 RepID=A0A2I2FJU3_ASPCN|nr:cyclin-like protein [Aspergillus candidus]PLB40891.1 cyclin-like protein [Aspergillus candidus]